MEDHLISKKDLLELTGISYGQLYRWKRKDLIPEDWFIRKSTFTGQETFFPKDKILARIEKIVNMKDNLSLDELADVFSPTFIESAIRKSELIERNLVSKVSLQFFTDQLGDAEVFTFQKIIYLYVLDKMLQTGQMSLEEGKMLLQVLSEHYPKLEGKNCEAIFTRKMGVSTFLLVSSPSEVYFEQNTTVAVRMLMASCIEELKAKLT